jgi:hypothetical protein
MSDQRQTVGDDGTFECLLRTDLGPERTVEALASEWFGIELPRAPSAQSDVPPLLRRLWDAGADRSMYCFHDWLLAEDSVETAEDGSLVFFAEHQWCWTASHRPGGGSNPEVSFDEGPGPAPNPMRPSGMLLDEFLMREALLSAQVAAPVHGFTLGEPSGSTFEQLLEQLHPVIGSRANEIYHAPSYWTDGRILVSGDRARSRSLHVGASRAADLAASPLRVIPATSWSLWERGAWR